MIEMEASWLRTALAAAQDHIRELERRADLLADVAEGFVSHEYQWGLPSTSLENAIEAYRQLRPKK